MRLLILALLVLTGVSVAQAQGIDDVPVFPTIAIPTIVPTRDIPDLAQTMVMPYDTVFGVVATANAQLQTAPNDLNNSLYVPDETGATLFRYTKWITSNYAATEVFGPFGVIPHHIGGLITLVLYGVAIFYIVWIVTLLIRFIVWLVKLILKAVPG